MTLDGMEQRLRGHFGDKNKRKAKMAKVNLIRYADDFAVTGANREVLEEARSLIEAFLLERGLSLSMEKTRITHIEGGFDFLGWNIRKYKGTLLIKPAKKNVQAVMRKIRGIIKAGRATKQASVIAKLNPVIRGWANYHRNQVASEAFTKVDDDTWRQLWRWARRRHPTKPVQWVKKRYFIREGRRNWVFAATVTNKWEAGKVLRLVRATDTPIRRHIKIKGDANPYDPKWERYLTGRTVKAYETAAEIVKPSPSLKYRQTTGSIQTEFTEA